MRAVRESDSLECAVPSRTSETDGPRAAPPTPSAKFEPLAEEFFGAESLSVPRLKAPVLQRAQRLYGNRATQKMVMRARTLQRQCPCGGTCAKCQAEEEQRALQRSAVSRAPADFESIPTTHGEPLDTATRAPLESHFGADLAGVRVHTGPEAAESAARLDALAYTAGRDIYFAHGTYAPASTAGQRLLAHEVAHVVQQSSGKEPTLAAKSSRGVKIGAPEDGLETEAENEARNFMAREPATVGQSHPPAQRDGARGLSAAGLAIQRKEAERDCCCCAETINIRNIRKKDTSTEWGHSFEAAIDLDYEKAATKAGCALEWWEKTDLPYGSFGMQPNKWTNIAVANPGEMVWPTGLRSPCSGKETFTEPDDGPALAKLPGRNATRTLYFAIRIKSAPGCPCSTPSQTTVFATQKLTMKDGKGETASFDEGIDRSGLSGLPES